MREEISAHKTRIDAERLHDMFCDMEKQARKPEWFLADHATRLYREITNPKTHPNLRQLYEAGWRAGLTVNGWQP